VEAVRLNVQGPFEGTRGGRTLVVMNVLPKTSRQEGQVPLYRFRSEYAQVLTSGGKPANPNVLNLPDAVLHSVEPPTDDEIKLEKNKLWDSQYKTQIIIVNGQASNRREVVLDYLKATENFDEDYRKKKARNYQVYLERSALAMLQSVADPKLPAPSMEDIWYAQMSLWVQQDVCNAIATLNGSRPEYKNIPTNPVKHLIAIEIPQTIAMYAIKGGAPGVGVTPAVPTPAAPPPSDTGGDTGGDASAAAAATPSATPGVGIDVKDYTLGPTGRVCNRLYDVVQFNVDVVVDAQMVKPFIQQLQYRQFINVLEMDVQGVDLDAALDEGFEYGKKPVVELKLKCEALFLRDWTAWVPSWVPADVRRLLNIPASSQVVQGPMPLEVQTKLGVQKPPPAAPATPSDATVASNP